jgi:hypothetical protein
MSLDATTHAAIPTARLPSPPWTRLGHGVWGDVFDLGDGSVLKLVRHKGGIGSGQDILFAEVRALDLLRGLTGAVATASLQGFGEIGQEMPDLADYCGWLRMTHLPGVTAMRLLSRIENPAQRAQIMRRIGEAAAQFHVKSAGLAPRKSGLAPLSLQRLDEIAAIVPEMASACGEVAAVLQAADQHPFLHGDINGGNVLFADPSAPATSGIGLVDLGEAQSGPVEIELRHLHDFGGPTEAMVEGYTDIAGRKPDAHVLAAAHCLNALGTLAISTLGTVPGLDPGAAWSAAQAALTKLP